MPDWGREGMNPSPALEFLHGNILSICLPKAKQFFYTVGQPSDKNR